MVLTTKVTINYYDGEYDFEVSKTKVLYGIFMNAYSASKVIQNEYDLDLKNKNLNIYNIHSNITGKNGGRVEWTSANKMFNDGETKKIFIIEEVDEKLTEEIYAMFKNIRVEKD